MFEFFVFFFSHSNSIWIHILSELSDYVTGRYEL